MLYNTMYPRIVVIQSSLSIVMNSARKGGILMAVATGERPKVKMPTISQRQVTQFLRRAIFPHMIRRYAFAPPEGPKGITLIQGEAGLEEVDHKALLEHADELGDQSLPCAECGREFSDEPSMGVDLAGVDMRCRRNKVYEIKPYCTECFNRVTLCPPPYLKTYEKWD
jgi:hypothetical protein